MGVGSLSILFGRIQERRKEITNIFKTLLDNKSASHSAPKLLKRLTEEPAETLAIVMPKPRQTLIAVIIIFFSVHPISEMVFIPIAAIDPNKMTIVPPITTSGIE